jgi:hypothetical protein
MKKNYKSFGLSQFLKKSALAASFAVAAFVSTDMHAQAYCSNPAGSAYGADIINVTLGSLNNSSACNALGGPGSIVSQFNTYTASVAAPTLVTGVSYPLSVDVDYCGNYGSYSSNGYIYVWIDFNNNGNFTDPGETVYSSGNTNWNYPQTVSPGLITIPTTTAVTAGIRRMRVIASDYGGSLSNACSSYFYGETEEYRVNIVLATPCSGPPATNTAIAGSATVCPNSGTALSLANGYINSGLIYQWYSSSFSSVGPFTPVTGATTPFLSSPNLTTTTWFQAVVTCTIGSQTTTTSAVQVSVVPTTTNSVPYFEGFENNSSALNKLPNCSWVRNVSAIVTTTNTNNPPLNGNGYASFYVGNCAGSVPANTGYLYSNGIQLNPGITYSAAVWYTGYQNTSVALMFGNAQTPGSLSVLDNDNNPNTNFGEYKLLSNTFTVATPGIYYMAIRNIDGSGSCSFNRISYDDLSVTIPCEIAANAPNMVVNAPAFICEGQAANLSASGASAYSWASGPNTPNYAPTPNIATTYSVTGSSTLTGCAVTIAKFVDVKVLPIVGIITPNNKVCAGSSISMNATGGAFTYTWVNTGTTGAFIAASPSVSTNYTVIGTGPFGCVGSTTQSITVNPLPVITVAGNRTICVTGGAFTASGALSYQWSSNSFFLQGTSVNPNPQQNTNVTVSGTDQNGCVGTTVLALVVDPCTGIASLNGNGIKNVFIYPNPNNGEFTIELRNGLSKTVELMDVTGRVVLATTTASDLVNLNISDLSNGIYHVKIKSNNAVEVLKVVKQ